MRIIRFFFINKIIKCVFKNARPLLLCLSFPISAFSQDIATPDIAANQADLIVIDHAGKEHRITPEEFAALPWTTLATHTAWTEGTQTFDGALARDVLFSVGLEEKDLISGSIEAVALNDYRISIPAADFLDFDVLIARNMNGQPMTRRDKGPYWIVYPRDDHPQLAESQYDHRWVWQLLLLRVQE